MKPVKQTKVGVQGNCYAACLASILELPIDDIPDVTLINDGAKQALVINDWLRKRFGLVLVEIEPNEERGLEWPDIWHIVNGPSCQHKDRRHSMVARAGKFVWNPGPEESHLKIMETFEIFAVADPARHKKMEAGK